MQLVLYMVIYRYIYNILTSVYVFDRLAGNFDRVTHFSPHWQCPSHRIYVSWAAFNENMNLEIENVQTVFMNVKDSFVLEMLEWRNNVRRFEEWF